MQAEDGGSGEIRQLIEAKTRWIDTPPDARQCTPALAVDPADQRGAAALVGRSPSRGWLNCRPTMARRLQAEKILAWREYGFCLYPETYFARIFCRGYFPKRPKHALISDKVFRFVMEDIG